MPKTSFDRAVEYAVYTIAGVTLVVAMTVLMYYNETNSAYNVHCSVADGVWDVFTIPLNEDGSAFLLIECPEPEGGWKDDINPSLWKPEDITEM